MIVALQRLRVGQPLVRGLAAGALAAALLAPAARADDVSEARAASLEAQLNTWLAAQLGPAADLDERTVTVTAAGDHFQVDLKPGEALKSTPLAMGGLPLAAAVRPVEDGRWSAEFEWPTGAVSILEPGQTVKTTTTTAIEEQTNRLLLDPTMATATTLDTTWRGYGVNTAGPVADMRMRADRSTMHAAAQPAAGGLLNLFLEQEIRLMTMNFVTPDTGTVSVSVERLAGDMHMDSVAPERLRTLVQNAVALAPAMGEAMRAGQAKHAGGKPKRGQPENAPDMQFDASQRAAVHAMVAALRDLSAGAGQSFTLENTRVKAAGFGGHADKLALGMGVAGQDGKLTMKLTMGADRLDSPDIPAGPLRDMIPRHILFAPRLAGIPGDAGIDLLLRAIDSNGADPALEDDTQALLHDNPLTVGLDEVAFDVGPAALTARGELVVAGKDEYSGHAHVAVTGLDALIRRANSTPMLKQAAPALIFLKGIGQQDGAATVWDIETRDGQLLVNGADMTQMMQGQ